MSFPKLARGPVLARDRRPPAARAHRPVPDPAKAIAAELGWAIPQPRRPDHDGMKHDGSVPRPRVLDTHESKRFDVTPEMRRELAEANRAWWAGVHEPTEAWERQQQRWARYQRAKAACERPYGIRPA